MKMEKRCLFCNSKENLHRHHIIPKAMKGNNKKINLIILCQNCHIILHTKLVNPIIKKVKDCPFCNYDKDFWYYLIKLLQGVVWSNLEEYEKAELLYALKIDPHIHFGQNSTTHTPSFPVETKKEK